MKQYRLLRAVFDAQVGDIFTKSNEYPNFYTSGYLAIVVGGQDFSEWFEEVDGIDWEGDEDEGISESFKKLITDIIEDIDNINKTQ